MELGDFEFHPAVDVLILARVASPFWSGDCTGGGSPPNLGSRMMSHFGIGVAFAP